MSDHPLPAELLVDVAPLTDDDLARYFDAQDTAENPDRDDEGDLLRRAMNVEPVAARWEIDGPKTCAWALAKYAAAEAELAELAERRDEYVARIGAWFEHGAKQPQRTLDFFAGHLERYAIAVRAESGGKTKSVVLPNGAVKTTATAAKVVVADEAALLVWAVDRWPSAVDTVLKLRVAELRNGVTVVEYPTSVVLAPCACVVDPLAGLDVVDRADVPPGIIADGWQVGSVLTCPQCGAEAMVGQWLETAAAAADKAGDAVPGAAVADAHVSAKIVAG